ncbi:MAG: putative heme transporter [Actinomycetota bacterium]|nr:putative heme transporter [Actinomycetota bacterium]
MAVLAIGVLLPRVAGTTWTTVVLSWRAVPWWQLGLLVGLWFVGLVAHSWVLTAAMPGLTRRRALTLNLTGSAVANVLPFGGGAGIALNFFMVRRWGFTAGQFSLFTLLSNGWNVLAKAALPALAVTALLVADSPIDPRLLLVATVGSGLLLLVALVVVYVVGSARGTHAVARSVDVLRRALRRPADGTDLESRLLAVRASARAVVRRAWLQMTVAMTAYSALGAALLWCCLHALGAGLGIAAVVALFAFERGVTALPITPGGVGVAEVATTAFALHVLSPSGVDPAALAAGVLLYRALAFGAEIPAGGLWLVGWFVANRGSGMRPTALPGSA